MCRTGIKRNFWGAKYFVCEFEEGGSMGKKMKEQVKEIDNIERNLKIVLNEGFGAF